MAEKKSSTTKSAPKQTTSKKAAVKADPAPELPRNYFRKAQPYKRPFKRLAARKG